MLNAFRKLRPYNLVSFQHKEHTHKYAVGLILRNIHKRVSLYFLNVYHPPHPARLCVGV